MSSEVEVVSRLLESARSKIWDSCNVLPDDVSSILEQLWADLEIRIADLLEEPIVRKLLAASNSSEDTAAMFFTMLAHLKERLSKAEATAANLRAQLGVTEGLCAAQNAIIVEMKEHLKASSLVVTDLQKQLKKQKEHYQKQTSALMLRQSSFMVVNKLVRKYLRNKDGSLLLFHEAARYNLNNLRSNRKADSPALEAFLASNSLLVYGLELMASTYSPVAHPYEIPNGLQDDGPPVTIGYLRQCLAAEWSDQSPDFDALEQVLNVLDKLSQQLTEPLFVPSAKP